MCIIINMYLTHYINQSFFPLLLKCLEINCVPLRWEKNAEC